MIPPACEKEISKEKKEKYSCLCRLRRSFSIGALLSFFAGIVLLINIFSHWLFGLAAVFAFAAALLFLRLRKYKK